MHVLVTGGNGYLGSVTLKALHASTVVTEITALVRKPERFTAGKYSWIPQEVVFVDLEKLVRGDMSLEGIDLVCHLAAGGRENGNPAEIASSLELTQTLLAHAVSANVKGFVVASSQAVYGTEPPVWHEGNPAAPVSFYGMGKHAAELLARQTAFLVPGMNTVSLRFSKLVGPSPMFRISNSELPHVLAYCAATGKSVTMPGDGGQMLDLLDVRDAASAIVRVLEKSPEQWPEVMNVGSGKQVTALEVVRTVSAVSKQKAGKPLHFKLNDTRKSPYRNFGISIERLEDFLQWRPEHTLEQTVTDVLSALKKSDA